MAEGSRAYSRASEVRKSPAFEVQTCFANEPYRFDNFGDGRPIELTSLCEQVMRMRRLPSGLDRNALFRELSSRMGYPEWEVRQHALRVLADIAPILPPSDVSLALGFPLLLPSTVNCLGHPSAAVRRASLDALRALLVASEDPDLVVDALVLHGLDGTDPDVAMGVILGIPALLSPRLPHQGMTRLVSALARKVIHSAFHEEALDTLSKIRSLVGEGQFDRFLSGFPPKYRRDFRALFRAHDVRSDNEDSSAETRARVKEMLANGILKEVEGQDNKKVKAEPGPANANGSGKPAQEVKVPPSTAAATVKPAKQTGKGSVKMEPVVVEEEEIDSANGSRPASAETRTEEHSVSEKGGEEDTTKAEPLLRVPEKEEDDASTSENDKASVENVGKGAAGGDGGNVTDEEGGELEDDEDSGVEGSGGRGEEGTEAVAPSPPPAAPKVAGRVLLETEIQFSEATAITMTILEEADVASNDGDPGRVLGRGRGGRLALEDEEFDPDVAIRVLDTSEEEGVGKIREVGRSNVGRRVRFGGEMVLQTPDSSAETLEVPKREGESLTNSSEDQEEGNPHGAAAKVTENQLKPGSVQFVSHIPVRVDGSKRQQKNAEGGGGDTGKSNEVTPPGAPSSEAPATEEKEAAGTETEAGVEVGGGGGKVEREGTRVEVTTKDAAKVKLHAEGAEVELLVRVVGEGEAEQEGGNQEALPVKPEVPIVMPMSASRVHSWEDLGIVDKQILVDIKNKEDWQARGRGINILKTALRDPAVSAMLYHHLPEFLFFLEPLLEDRSIPVVTAALGAVRNICSAPALRPRLSSPAILRRLTASLCRRAAHTHVAIRAAAASAAKALMRAAGPKTVLPPLLNLASAPRAPGHRVRESALVLTLHAILAFPSGDFDAGDVARRTAPALADPKRRVRQAALECMAVLAQFVPPETLPLSLATERLRSRKARRGMETGVAARLSRRRLPVVTTDGLILYALQIPPTASRGMPGTPTGADVDWILAGTGSISSGSAMSRGNYSINRSDSPLMPTPGAHVPVYKDASETPITLRNRPDSPIAWNNNSPWLDSKRNQSNLAPVGPIGVPDQRSHSAENNNFTGMTLRGARDANKPASSPCMGTNGVAVSSSPWSAANRGEGGEGCGVRRQAPTLQVASMSSSFSSSTSSNSSASSGASTTSTSNPPTIGYFRPVYNGPRHLGVIEDVVTERGFSILPDKMIPVNAITASPGKAPPILGQTGNPQGSRRLRSPSPPAGCRSRRHLAPVQRQSSTDSRPSSPTSNDSSIPPHRSTSAAPLPIHSQTATLSPGRWSAGGGRWTAQYVGDTSTTNHECTSGTPSGQERIFTSDESSTQYRSDSSSGRRVSAIEQEEILKVRRPMIGEPLAVAYILTVAEESPRIVEITELEEKETVATEGEEIKEEKGAEEGVKPEVPAAEKTAASEDGVQAEEVDGAAGSALGAALALVAADGSFPGVEGVGGGGGGGVGGGGAAEKAVSGGGEGGGGVGMPSHPCVPEGAEKVQEGGGGKEEGKKEEEEGGSRGVKEAKEEKNEMLKEGAKDGEGEGGEEKGGKGGEGEEKKDEGREKGEEGCVEGGEVEVEGRVEGAGSGEGSKGAAVQASPVQTDQSDALGPPSAAGDKEINCGGAALPVDLSVGLLGADIDERLRAAEETGHSFTTLPPGVPCSPPPRPKHLSCSYPSGTLQLTPEDLQEHPMSATFVVPHIYHDKGGDATNLPPSVSVPNTAFSTRHPGQTRNGKIPGQQREGRRSLPNRTGASKQSTNSVASAPAVHPSRSSSTSTSLFPETLPPVKNPKEALRGAFQNMDDPDWEVAMKGLELLVRLIRHHPTYVQGELTRVIATLARQIRNLRSQVARAACQASGELALPRVAPASPTSVASDSSVCSTSLLRRALEADLEEVAAPLLHRSADTNRFLRDDCVAALDRFVAGVGPSRVVGPILSKGVTHQNALVRTVTARLLATIVAKLGAERVMTQLNKDVRAKVLRSGANLLMEGSLQTRTYAKQVFRCLAAHENFDRALTQAVPTTVLRNIHKTLLSIKKESIASVGVDQSWDA